MYVCLCKNVNEGSVRECVRSGCCSLRDVSARTGLATQCGRCARHAQSVIAETLVKLRESPEAAVCAAA
jgi:bacterioferritin-associated ferredoxin